jgi:FkbM family methyltransferase
VSVRSPARGRGQGRLRAWRRGLGRLVRLLGRALRHPGYALWVLGVLALRPRLLLQAVRRGWQLALHAHCARLQPAAADLLTPYEAGFFGQVFLFDEYEVGRLPLPPAPVVVDVGANVGLFSWRVCAYRPDASVLAFEPQSHNHARLCRLFEVLGIRGEACRQACGAAPGSATLYLRSSVTHSLRPDWHPDLDVGAGVEEVQVTTLDGECARRGLAQIDLLKVDVEGAEVEVLAGARAVLERTRFVVLEYHSPDRRAQCLQLLRTAGFRCRDKRFWGSGGGGEGLLLCARRAGAPSPRRAFG